MRARTAPTVPALLYTPADAAQALAIGRSAVYELIAAGKLKSVQIGRSQRVPVAECEAFIVRQMEGQS